MSQSPFPQTQKPFPDQYTGSTHGGTSAGGRACGCFALGCGGLIALLIAFCGMGYYAVMHTSLPLSMLERSIEESGNVRVEGLRGNVSTGIEVDKFEFRDDSQSEEWSSLEGLKFKYNGMMNMTRTNRMIIDEIKVDGGTFYTSLGNGEFNLMPLDFGFKIDEIIQRELKDVELSGGMGEVRIDQVNIRDLTWIDRKNDLEFQIDEIKYSGLLIQGQRVTNVGDVTIKTDNLDLQSYPSQAFELANTARLLQGEVKPGNNTRILRNIPFEFDFSVGVQKHLLFKSSWFEGQVLLERVDPEGLGRVEFKNYSPAEFIQTVRPQVCPHNVSLKIEVDPGNVRKPMSVEPGGQFTLGATRFEGIVMDAQVNDAEAALTSQAEVGQRLVTATISLQGEFPMLRILLEDELKTPPQELWAEVVFGKSFDQLTVPEQEDVLGSIAAADAGTPSVEKESPADQEPTSAGDQSDTNAPPSDKKQPTDGQSSADQEGKTSDDSTEEMGADDKATDNDAKNQDAEGSAD